MTPSRYGRVILETSLNKKEDWFTVLIIRNLKESDSGDYTFTVRTGPATKVMTKSLVVIPKHGKDWTCHNEIPIFRIFLGIKLLIFTGFNFGKLNYFIAKITNT